MTEREAKELLDFLDGIGFRNPIVAGLYALGAIASLAAAIAQFAG